jgi:diamine N-acetyltransferase
MKLQVELKDVNAENFWDSIYLKSSNYDGHHLFEEHVTSNAFSIAQSKVEPEWEPKCIYYADEIVGFAMYGFSSLLKLYFVTRLMIDYKHQGKGLGKAAMLKIVEDMRKYHCEEIYTSIVPHNYKAKKLYEGIGFVDTGRMIEFGGESEPLYKYCY